MAPTPTSAFNQTSRDAVGTGTGTGKRVIVPRRGLPGSRAVVGGLLVALAALGTFLATAGAGRGPTTRYVVAARPIAPGHRIGRGDLRLTAIDLPAPTRAAAFDDATALIGGTALGPVEPGELVQSGTVLPSGPGGPIPELSFAIDPDRAVGGSLRSGDRIDLLVTYGSGRTSTTERVVAGAHLRDVQSTGAEGLGDVRHQVLVVGFDDPADILPATNAVRAGELTVVRTTGGTPTHGPSHYTPDSHADDATGGHAQPGARSHG